jgi:hypothetical protein
MVIYINSDSFDNHGDTAVPPSFAVGVAFVMISCFFKLLYASVLVP